MKIIFFFFVCLFVWPVYGEANREEICSSLRAKKTVALVLALKGAEEAKKAKEAAQLASAEAEQAEARLEAVSGEYNSQCSSP